MFLKSAIVVSLIVALFGLNLTAAMARSLEGDPPRPGEGAREAVERLFSSGTGAAQTAGQEAPSFQSPANDEMARDIYESPTAKELVREARKFDPMFCPADQRDRDKAALLYERAIDSQPGAKINAPLANRIAQMYASYEDREKNVKPDRAKARWWWFRCLELTNPRQLLWAQAQMGLSRYDEILEMDVRKVELDDWRVWPERDSAQAASLRQSERERIRRHLTGLQARVAVKKADLAKQLAEQGKVVPETRQPSALVSTQRLECSISSRRCLKPRRFALHCRLRCCFARRRLASGR